MDLAISPDRVTGEYVRVLPVPLKSIEKLDGILWDDNPKKHDIGGIYQSIERYGFQDAPKYDSNLNGGKGGIVFGNGRTKTIVSMLIEARKAGKEPPRGIPIDKETGDWCIPIAFGVDQKSEAEAIALGIDHNNLTMSGGDFTAFDMAKMWDTESYIELLSSIADQEITPITMDEEAIGSLLMALAGEQEDRSSDSSEDLDDVLGDAERDNYEIRVKAGEIWKLGRHYIACGDCTIEDNIDKLLVVSGCKLVDMVWADPPYGVSEETNRKEKGRGKLAGNLDFPPVLGDSSADVAKDSFELALRLFSKAKHCWWGANYYPSVLPFESGWIVWDKRDGIPSDDNADCEIAWSNNKKPMRIFSHLWRGCIKASEHGQKKVHPTQKPVKLFVWFAEKYGNTGDMIMDLFLGSGMSIIGCEELNDDRRVIGFELSERYCSVILDRWEQFTGQTAVLAGSL